MGSGMIDEWAKTYGSWAGNPSPKTRRGAGDSAATGWDGVERRQRGPRESNVRLVRPPAYGLSSEDLFNYQRTFTRYAANRLTSVGREQYDRGSKQKFEDMTVTELVDGLREELADIVNYATMIDIQLVRWLEKVKASA